MKKINHWVFVILLLSFALGCNPFTEMREARTAAERANREAKTILENVKEHALKAEMAAKRAEEAAQRAEAASASAENFSKKAEAASQKAVGTFERQLKK